MSQVNTGEELTYWHKWLEGRDAQAGDILAKKYLPLVSYHVQRIGVNLPKNVNREELRSLGNMGLFDALEKFDPSRDLKFETYASFRIRGAIIDGLRKEDWLPRSTREKAKLIESTVEALEQRKMRNITPDEIAAELGLTEDEVIKITNENFFSNVLSMDEQPHDSLYEQDSQSYTVKDDRVLSPEEKLVKKELLAEMEKYIQKLGEKEQLVLDLFYRQELTLTEIGYILNLSTSRISQIHSRALFKLKDLLSKVIYV